MNSGMVPEVKIPLIFIIEILFKRLNVITILMTRTMLYCESMVFAPVEAKS